MLTEIDAKEVLRHVSWKEGKVVPVVRGPYRFEIVVVCSSQGRQKTVFLDGTQHPYFSYVRIVNTHGQWRGEGGIIVPVLPNGQLLMVVEQRPPRWAFQYPQPAFIEFSDRRVALSSFGPYSSLEFPGGGVADQEELSAGFLRELQEETGVSGEATLYQRIFPHYQMNSDIATRDFLSVAYLEGMHFEPKTHDDGGLTVLAMWPNEILTNIRNGVIASAHAGQLPWAFYKEMEEFRSFASPENNLSGYVKVRHVKLKK